MSSVVEFIRSHHWDVLARWTPEAQRTASARGLDEPTFANLFPAYLTALGRSDGDLGRFGRERRELVESHVGARLRQGFDPAEVVEEFALLGRCIVGTWAELEPSSQPAASEVERLYLELHLASAAVTRLFNDHLLKDEQAEKRYLRLLQALAREGLAEGGVPLRQRLRPVVELVMEALGAQGAALALFDAGGRLAVTAAAGLAEDGLHQYAALLDPATFTGQVAARERAVSVDDVATTALALPPDLRESGLHGLMGVRLPSRPPLPLVGILLVGLAEARAFTNRETQRLESLAEQLALHLDNARLYADLQEKVAALRLERELREQFVSLLAHDLRGPLTAARATAQLLARRPARLDERRSLAHRLEASLDRADRMIRDLLDASRLRAGEALPLQRAPCALPGLARAVAAELAQTFGDRFEVVAEEEVAGLWDPELVRRALWNLASNAAKYGAPQGLVTLAVRRAGPWAEVSVHNQGNPLSREEQGRLFQPFGRARTAGKGGWGLGLVLVRGAAEAHGGSVQVDSAPGRGTTFTLRLPLAAHAAVSAPEAGAPA